MRVEFPCGCIIIDYDEQQTLLKCYKENCTYVEKILILVKFSNSPRRVERDKQGFQVLAYLET